ncbi:hypothetical protein FOMPIDRAFT_101146 [Fomitopsis schrenkii]|uniref:DUF6533 domain-containing protein n=1 Tax=Fomitopsis schrenkii TaxID=2126942 RepID=S8FGQ8_FOMSC|nr:hypothetical protein FOMPIDRAFT_101146 [Fomitopsis schrenkii]
MADQGGISLTPAEANAAESFLLFYYYFENSLYWTATTLCCYDWCLTFDREVESIWKTEQSLVTILFYGFRYPALLNTVIELLSRMSWPSWQSNYVSCPFPSSIPDAHIPPSSLMMSARAASLLSDGVVLVLTAIKTFRVRRATSDSTRGRSLLTDIMLRDTLLCFALLCTVNVLGLATGHLTLTIRGIFCDCEFIEAWQFETAILNSVLLSRLTLDIRGTSRSGGDSSLPTSGLLSGLSSPDGDTTEEAIELDTEVSLWANPPSGSTGRNAMTSARDPPAE